MIEQWTRWEPIEGLEGKYDVEFIVNNLKEFTMLLVNPYNTETKIQVIFENSVNAYTKTNESYRQRIVSDLSDEYGSDFYGAWTFFKVNNSTYLRSLLQQPSGSINSSKFIHFAFVAYDSIIDVIATYEPKVILINNSGNKQ